MGNPNIPVGISDFKEIVRIITIILIKAVSYLTPNRWCSESNIDYQTERFGKTLGMSMLYYFFNVRNESQNYLKGLKFQEITSFVKNG